MEFVSAIDTSGETKTGQYIADCIAEALEQIGVENCVQVRTGSHVRSHCGANAAARDGTAGKLLLPSQALQDRSNLCACCVTHVFRLLACRW